MSIEKVLFERLKNQVSTVSNRIYGGDVAPQTVKNPYIVFKKENAERQYSHQGYSNLEKATMLIYCFDTGYEAVQEVADEVIQAIESWRADGVQAAFIIKNHGHAVQDLYFYDLKLFSCSITAELWHNA